MKKISLCLILIGLLLVSNINVVGINLTNPKENNQRLSFSNYIFSDTGTVKYLPFEGGFYGIIGDKGQSIYGEHCKNYEPVNLPEELKIDGTRINFTAELRTNQGSIHMWGVIIEIISITKLGNSTNYIFNDTGKIKYLDLGYTIIADNSQIIENKSCNHFIPITLPEEFKKDGIRVNFTAAILPDPFSIYDEGMIVEIKNITKIGEVTGISFSTWGPNLLRYRKITFQDGKLGKILALKVILRRNILPRALPFIYYPLLDDTIDFTLEYINDSPSGNISTNFYFTKYGDRVDNKTINEKEIWNVRHKLVVEDFEGIIIVFRSFILPPHFTIVGECKNLTITYP